MIPPTYLIKSKINRPEGRPPKLKITSTEIIILQSPESRHSFFVGKPHILFNVSHGKKGKKTVGVGLFVHILYKYLSQESMLRPFFKPPGDRSNFQINGHCIVNHLPSTNSTRWINDVNAAPRYDALLYIF